MENTYQDLITDIQSKNPQIGGKLEGGKKFKIKSDFKPAGDQPEAIKKVQGGYSAKIDRQNAGDQAAGMHVIALLLRHFPVQSSLQR